MKKILISAYACEPNRGSEPGVGWNWVENISKNYEVYVITRDLHRKPILEYLKKKNNSNLNFIFIKLPLYLDNVKKISVHAHYLIWQLFAYFNVNNSPIKFDLSHHITFVNYWMPSSIAFLPIPFVWGPVGGGESAPSVFCKQFSFKNRMNEYLRLFVRGLANINPLIKMAAHKSKIAFSTSGETSEKLKRLGCHNIVLLSQVFLPDSELKYLGASIKKKNAIIKFVSVGRMLYWKGFDLGLIAFSKFIDLGNDGEFIFIGDGPEKKRLEELAYKLGIKNKVSFFGNLNRKKTLDLIKNSDVLVHPSLHDSGAFVCAEAMAAGLPVLCLDLGGPGLHVTEECGFKIRATNPLQVIDDFKDAMVTLSSDERLFSNMRKSAKSRAKKHFSWNAKSKKIKNAYLGKIN